MRLAVMAVLSGRRHGGDRAARSRAGLLAAVLFAALLAIQPAAAGAQGAEPAPAVPADDALARAAQEIERLRLLIDRIDAATQREGLGDRQLGELRREIDPVLDQARAVAALAEPRVQAVEQRLRQLGPPPGEGRTESEVITVERAQQAALLAELQAAATQARLLAVRAEQLSARIVERRRALFTERIFERRDSALLPALWYDAVVALPRVTSRVTLLLSDWWRNLSGQLGAAALAGLGLGLVLAGAIAQPIRRRLLRLAARDPALISPPRLRKTAAAVWLALVHFAVPTAVLLVLYSLLAAFGLLPTRIERLFDAVIRFVALFSLIRGLSWGLFAPSRPTWRLLPFDTVTARRLHRLTVAIAAIYALDEIVDTLNAITFAPLAVSVAKEVLSGVIIAILFGAALALAWPRAAGPDGRGSGAVRWTWLLVVGALAAVSIPVSAAFGFLALASFVTAQIVIGATILAVLMLTIWLIDAAVADWIEGPDGAAGRIGAALGAGREKVVQTAIMLAGLLRILVVLAALSLLLVPWGVESKDVFGWLRTAFFGFSIGDITISFSSILLALGIFLAGAIVTRAIQRWLDQRLLPHTQLDTGIRNSLKTAFGYFGLIIAAAVGFAYLGLDLSNLAIIAGALSVGIGFGLQSVVNNFVSGLILLAERPIKVGDWVVVGDEQGYVSKISVRSTQIETFDRATVIVPNSDLISGVVKNWMHSNLMGRIHVAVSVSYSADPEQVRDILLACAEAHPAILRDPAPSVFFMEFGESSLDFDLRGFISNVNNSLGVRSDLRFAIFKALREAGIEIPFPQRDLHLRDIDRLEKALAAGREAPAGPRRRARRTAT